MDFDNIKITYRTFEKEIYNSHSLLSELLTKSKNFLVNYSKFKHFDKQFAENFDENLICLETVYSKIDEILEHLEQISLLELKQHDIENVASIYEYMDIPDDYDIEIYADLNHPIDF